MQNLIGRIKACSTMAELNGLRQEIVDTGNNDLSKFVTLRKEFKRSQKRIRRKMNG